MNPFEVLGIEPRLILEREQLNQAFRKAGKSAHPDAGGLEEDFAQLQAAMDILASPARRLRAWLELKGVEVDSRGSIGSELMDEFGRVGDVTQQAEAIIRKRETTRSALAMAMLEDETQRCRETLEGAIARIDSIIVDTCSKFEALEQAERIDPAAMEWHRNLKFLEKWQASLKGLYARLL